MSFLEATGARLGPYRLVHRIGEGGMGVVHLGVDDDGRAVAIKVLRPHVAGDPVARERLAREVSSLRRVRHPRVAPFLDADVDCDTPYVVTLYVPAPSLEGFVRASGPLDAGALARLGNGLGEALAAIHDAGVVHRDLKPANVLLQDGDPVVIDFGIAHVVDDVRLTGTGFVLGTPGYLSPEVLAGEPVVQATDWWGWAATMAFAATGRPPFGRGPVEVVLDRVRRAEFDLDGVPASLVPVLTRALDVDVARRPEPWELRVAVEELRSLPTVRVPVGRAGSAVPEPPTAPVRAAAPAPAPAAVPTRVTAPAPPTAPIPLAGDLALRRDLGFGDVHDHDAVQDQGLAPAPRPRRSGTLFAGLVALAATAAVVPLVVAIVGFAGAVLARTVDRTSGSWLRRRYERGPRRGDVARAVASSPGHLLGATIASVPAALVPAMVGVATVFVVGWLVGPGGTIVPGDSVPLAAGAVAATVTAWWGPGGSSVRRGSRTIVRALTPGRRGAQIVVALLLIVTAGALTVVLRGSGPDWTPLERPPTVLGG